MMQQSKSHGYILLLLLLMLTGNGCAYRAGFGERRIPGGYNQMAVPVFKNETIESGIEVYFTNAMIRELERSNLAKVASKSESQVTLEGIVTSVVYTPAGAQVKDSPFPAGTVLTTQYQILVSTKLQLRRNSDQKVLWSGSFTGERSYSAPKIGTDILNSANAVYNHSAHYQNIALMANDMMSEAHDQMTENF